MKHNPLHFLFLLSGALCTAGAASAQSNYSTGTLPAGLEYNSGSAGIYTVADFNGDGAADILYHSGIAAGLVYLQNNGSGTFSTPTPNPFANFTASTPAGFALSASSTTADFDGDGDLDIWFRVSGASNDIYLRNDAGTYVSAAVPSGMEFTASSVQAVAVADFSGDGKVDIAYTTGAGAAIIYLLNNGSGSFSTPGSGNPFVNFVASSPGAFAFTSSSSVADFDADGDLDVWFRVINAGNDIYLRNDAGTYVSTTLPAGLEFTASGGVGAASVADFNGDGYPDVLYTTAVGTPLVYVQNDGGTFSTPATHPFSAYASSGIANFALTVSASVSDIDADGDLDVWVRVAGTGNDVYLTNTGAAPAVTSTVPANGALAVDRNANIVLNFSEAMFKGSGNIYIRKLSDNSIVETIPVTGALVTGNGTATITINPVTILAANTAYYVTFDRQALRDNDGIIMGSLDPLTRTREPETSPSFLTFTTGSTILAIKLMGIKATATEQGNCDISWTAVGDNATDKMELQRSLDGNIFQTIYTTASRIGTHQYTYTDEGVNGKLFYRIKMVTADGSYAYSEIVTATIKSALQFEVYPNPVTDKVMLVNSMPGTACLYDISGRLVRSYTLPVGKTTVDMQALPSGTYFLQFNTGAAQRSSTIVKQ
ncbi:FG-GAP-like repeat-containing protein [Edaphocola aurantiacus]|uniref:FG-GAP-like repeat-containing protein n=1 Tax=Edaphocola aurantiacus TaxID=2601682 RepID=UPI001C97BFA7|nr:FG-GAP-like repeat-containing protein [Edaphocola aurantiacus]